MQDEYTAAIKITPAAAGTIYSQLTLNDWVAIITIAYVALQIGLLLPKYRAQYPALWDKLRARLAALKAAFYAKVQSWRDRLVTKVRTLFGKAGV
ncbi:MAG: hypothetical protein WCD42_03745 [Rhizomicrobium sp.]